MEVRALIEGVLKGERRAVARAISMVEDGADDLPDLIAGLYPRTGTAYPVGLTGSPGVGKSSLAAELVTTVRRHDRTVAVLAGAGIDDRGTVVIGLVFAPQDAHDDGRPRQVYDSLVTIE